MIDPHAPHPQRNVKVGGCSHSGSGGWTRHPSPGLCAWSRSPNDEGRVGAGDGDVESVGFGLWASVSRHLKKPVRTVPRRADSLPIYTTGGWMPCPSPRPVGSAGRALSLGERQTCGFSDILALLGRSGFTLISLPGRGVPPCSWIGCCGCAVIEAWGTSSSGRSAGRATSRRLDRESG